MLKEYRYAGGEITRWFVEAWDQFESFDAACTFMEEQISEKKYRAYCFQTDWPAVIDRFLFIKGKLAADTEPADPAISNRILATAGA